MCGEKSREKGRSVRYSTTRVCWEEPAQKICLNRDTYRERRWILGTLYMHSFFPSALYVPLCIVQIIGLLHRRHDSKPGKASDPAAFGSFSRTRAGKPACCASSRSQKLGEWWKERMRKKEGHGAAAPTTSFLLFLHFVRGSHSPSFAPMRRRWKFAYSLVDSKRDRNK